MTLATRIRGQVVTEKGQNAYHFFQFGQLNTMRPLAIGIGLIRFCNTFWATTTQKNARDIMWPKMILSKDHLSKLILDQNVWAETWSWGFKPSTDKTEATPTQSGRENGRGTKHVFESNLTAQWPGLAHSQCTLSQNMWDRVQITYPKRPGPGSSRLPSAYIWKRRGFVLASSPSMNQRALNVMPLLPNGQCFEVVHMNRFRFTLPYVVSIHWLNDL